MFLKDKENAENHLNILVKRALVCTKQIDNNELYLRMSKIKLIFFKITFKLVENMLF